MTTPTTPSDDLEAAASDGFNGDDGLLIRSIEALLSLDASSSLVPHGIGGHARTLLSASASRISERLADKARIAELEGERDEARAVVIDCNNSLFGSQGYFVSEQAAAIEGVKEHGRRQWARAERAEFLLAVAAECAEDQSEFLLGWKNQALNAEAALRASQEALEGALSADFRAIALGALKDAHRAGESHEMAARWVAERIRQTLAQVEGGGG